MLGLALLICFAPFSVSAACAAIWGSARLAAAMPLLISMRRRLSLTLDICLLLVDGRHVQSYSGVLYGRGSAKGEMAGSMRAAAFVAAATFDDAETGCGAKG